jgi:hypothetical protein
MFNILFPNLDPRSLHTCPVRAFHDEIPRPMDLETAINIAGKTFSFEIHPEPVNNDFSPVIFLHFFFFLSQLNYFSRPSRMCWPTGTTSGCAQTEREREVAYSKRLKVSGSREHVTVDAQIPSRLGHRRSYQSFVLAGGAQRQSARSKRPKLTGGRG